MGDVINEAMSAKTLTIKFSDNSFCYCSRFSICSQCAAHSRSDSDVLYFVFSL